MNAIGATILSILLVVVLIGSRRTAALGMIAGVLYLTGAQQVQVLGLNVFAMRFLEVAGFIRILSRREFSFSNLNRIDRGLILVYSYTTIIYLLRSTAGDAVIIAQGLDALLCYFTFRGLIRDMEELQSFLRYFLILLVPYTLLAISESLTHRNLFSLIGGGAYDWVRNGRFRCMGSFRNPDLLGTLGACFLPLYIGLACIKAERKLAILGIVLCLIIVWTCNSGGATSSAAIGVLGWAMWRIRFKMSLVRRTMAVTIILLAIVMKAPIWYLLARVSEITGGDGWHRAYLLDISFQHFDMWWLNGMRMADTWDWFPYSLQDGADITNEFMIFGLNAGMGAMILFILLLIQAYRYLARALDSVRSNLHYSGEKEFMLWGLGVMLTAHIVNWMGISYFDQIYVIWFMQLAAISAVSESCIITAAAPVPAEMLAEEEDQLAPEMASNNNFFNSTQCSSV
jgi:hypothetical protein